MSQWERVGFGGGGGLALNTKMLWLGFTRQEANPVPLWPGSSLPLFIYWPALYSRAYHYNPNKPSLSLIS
jgi:hypothetical protein